MSSKLERLRWIHERQWHPSQQIEELPSGGLILRLRVGRLDKVG